MSWSKLLATPSVVASGHYPSTQEAETRRKAAQDQPEPHRESQASVGYGERTCLKIQNTMAMGGPAQT